VEAEITQRVAGDGRLDHALSSPSKRWPAKGIELDRTTKKLLDIEDAPQGDGDKARSKAAQLKASGRSRLEAISVYRIEKIVRKGRGKNRFNGYWYAAWVKSGKSRNVYLGNCDKISMEEALEKAKRIKAADRECSPP
jgi:hypothetical protein